MSDYNMPHLLSCNTVLEPCTERDLAVANDVALACARHWKMVVWWHEMMMKNVSYSSTSRTASSDSWSMEVIFLRAPRHTPHPYVESNPFALQVHCLLLQPVLRLHRTTFRSSFGAAGLSELMGKYSPSFSHHPQASGCMSFPIHCWTWRKTRWLWRKAVADVGGRTSGFTNTLHVPTFSWKRWRRRISNFSSGFPL